MDPLQSYFASLGKSGFGAHTHFESKAEDTQCSGATTVLNPNELLAWCIKQWPAAAYNSNDLLNGMGWEPAPNCTQGASYMIG